MASSCLANPRSETDVKTVIVHVLKGHRAAHALQINDFFTAVASRLQVGVSQLLEICHEQELRRLIGVVERECDLKTRLGAWQCCE